MKQTVDDEGELIDDDDDGVIDEDDQEIMLADVANLVGRFDIKPYSDFSAK